MAAEQRTITQNGTSDALFRAWGSDVSDLWQDNGLTKTSDTGQINWTTVTRPAGGSSTSLVSAGYEIFRLTTDTHQTTFPLFIKVEYLYGSSTYNQLGLTFQVGQGTNGAGTLTGITTKKFEIKAYRDGVGSQTHYCSGGDGRFCWAGHWEEAATQTTNDYELKNTIFIIERLRDNSGSVTNSGVFVFHTGLTSQFENLTNAGFSVLRPDDTFSPDILTNIGSVIPSTTGNRVNDLYLFTHHPADYALYNPVLSNLFYYYGDLTTGVNISVDMYGTTRTYKPVGRNATSSSSTGSMVGLVGHSNSAFLMLWE